MYKITDKKFIIQEFIGVMLVILGAVLSLLGNHFDVLIMIAFFISGAAIVRNSRRKQLISEIRNCNEYSIKMLKAKKWIESKQRKIDTFLVIYASPLIVIIGYIVYLNNNNRRIFILLSLVIVIAVYDFVIIMRFNEVAKKLIHEDKENQNQ